VVIDGFRRHLIKRVTYKEEWKSYNLMVIRSIEIDYRMNLLTPLLKILGEVPLSNDPSFLKVIPKSELMAYEEENKKRNSRFKIPYLYSL